MPGNSATSHDNIRELFHFYAEDRPVDIQAVQGNYADFIDNLPCGVCKVRNDADLTILYANLFYFQILGYSALHIPALQKQKKILALYPPDLPLLHQEILANSAQGRGIFDCEVRASNRFGNLLWLAIHCRSVSCNHELLCIVVDITKRKERESQIVDSEEEHRLALQHTGKTVFRYEIPTRTLVLPPQSAQFFNVPSRVPNAPYSMVEAKLVADESVSEFLRFYDSMNKGDSHGNCAIRFRNGQGEYVWLRMDFSVVYSKNGHPQHAVVSYEDITEQREKELAYEKWHQYNNTQLAGSIGYYECNLTRDTFERLDGPLAALVPQTVLSSYSAVFRYVCDNFVYAEDQAAFATTFSRENLLSHFDQGKRELSHEHRRIGAQGNIYWALSVIQILPDPYSGDIKIFARIKDIDCQKKEELKLQQRSQFDALTGLLNRGATIEQVTSLLDESKQSCNHTFMMVDIDNFKNLNDSLGHQFGDRVLSDVARDLKSVLRSDDIIGRLGGDEFVICLKGMGPGVVLEEKATLLRRLLSKQFTPETVISGSIGISLYPCDGLSFAELYQKADIALYEAKKHGRNQYVFFKAEMQSKDWAPYNNTPIDSQPAPLAGRSLGSAYRNAGRLAEPPGVSPFVRESAKTLALQDQENLLRYYNIALRNTYDELFELNITEDSYRIVYHVPHKYVLPPEKGPLTQMVSDMAAHTIHPDDSQRFLDFCAPDTIRRELAQGAESLSGEFRKLRVSGEYKWASLKMVPMGSDKQDELVLCFITDIAAKKQAEEIAHQNSLLRQRQMDDERYRIIVEQTGTIVLEYNALKHSLYVSPEALQFTFAEHLSLELDHDFLNSVDVHPGDWALASLAAHSVEQGSTKAETTIRLRKTDNQYLWCKVALTILRDKEGSIKRSIVTINDVDSATKDRKSLEYRAEYDDLTGYYNFSTFKIDVGRLLPLRAGGFYSLWYCDLRNFKLLNDIYGYDMGDRVLQYWAKILAEASRPGETFARVSADHFALLRQYERTEDLQERFARMVDNLANYAELEGKKFRLEVVAGVYCIEQDGDILSIEDMIDRANIAQKSVKNLSGSRLALYSEEMRKQLLHERSIEATMHSALEKREFCIYLQPLVDIQHADSIIGAEALARWNRPGSGLVFPADFIPLFEKNAFIVELDAFIFEEVCRFLHDRQERGLSMLKIAVNVSRISVFRPDFVTRYSSIKERYAIPDKVLDLECTETTMVENANQLNRIMSRMRSKGFLLSLDDFGSGYSSLNMLKDVTVDILKLDMMFFSSNIHAKRDRAIITSIIAMARALDMKIVAEGVESQEQLSTLRELGCDVVQGFLFGKAVPSQDFENLYLDCAASLQGKKPA